VLTWLQQTAILINGQVDEHTTSWDSLGWRGTLNHLQLIKQQAAAGGENLA
jgi:hypothetical protein